MTNIIGGMKAGAEIVDKAADIGIKIGDTVEDHRDRKQERAIRKREANLNLAAGVIQEADAAAEIVDKAADIGIKIGDTVEDHRDRKQERVIRKREANLNLAAGVIQEADAALGIILQGAHVLDEVHGIVRRHGPYGFIHKQAFIRYNGKNAKLVWDYLLWNELTVEVFVPGDVSIKYSIAEKLSDKETRRLYNKIVMINTLENLPDADDIEKLAEKAERVGEAVEKTRKALGKMDSSLVVVAKHHGSKVKQGSFAECKITKYADKACIFDEVGNRHIFLTSDTVRSCRFIEKKFKHSRLKTYYYYEIDFQDGETRCNSYVRMSDKYRECLEKYVPVIYD